MFSCFFFLRKKIAKGLDRMVLTGSCGPTPVLGVHGINEKSGFLGLKNRFSSRFPVFTVRPPGPTSRSGPVLKTMVVIGKKKKKNITMGIEKSIQTYSLIFFFFFENKFIRYYIILLKKKKKGGQTGLQQLKIIEKLQPFGNTKITIQNQINSGSCNVFLVKIHKHI